MRFRKTVLNKLATRLFIEKGKVTVNFTSDNFNKLVDVLEEYNSLSETKKEGDEK